MIYSLLGSVSSFENYLWEGGGGGGRPAPPPSLILQKCVLNPIPHQQYLAH